MNYFEKATELWGDRLQLIKTMEECGEVIQAISKYLITTSELLKPFDNDYYVIRCESAILQEVCDLDIMLEQVRIIFKELDWSRMMKMKIQNFEERVIDSMKKEGEGL